MCQEYDDDENVSLFKGTLGCKTGITKSAGPCFSGYFSKVRRKGGYQIDNVIVVVLGCKSMGSRWIEVPSLVRWYQKLKKFA